MQIYNLYSLKIHLYEQKNIIKIKSSIRSLIEYQLTKAIVLMYTISHTLLEKKIPLTNYTKRNQIYEICINLTRNINMQSEKWTKWLKGLKRKISQLISEWESSIRMLYIHKSIYKFNKISIISIKNLKENL